MQGTIYTSQKSNHTSSLKEKQINMKPDSSILTFLHRLKDKERVKNILIYCAKSINFQSYNMKKHKKNSFPMYTAVKPMNLLGAYWPPIWNGLSGYNSNIYNSVVKIINSPSLQCFHRLHPLVMKQQPSMITTTSLLRQALAINFSNHLWRPTPTQTTSNNQLQQPTLAINSSNHL